MTGWLSGGAMRAVARSAFHLVIEVTLLTPVILAVHAFWLTAYPAPAAVLLLVGFGMAGAVLRAGGVLRQLWHLVLSAVCAAGVVWLLSPQAPAVWLLAVASVAAWLRGVRHVAGDTHSSALYTVGIAIFAVAGAVFPNVPALAPAVAPLYVAGLAGIAFFFLYINEQKLAAAIDRKDGGKSGLAFDMIVRNRLYVLGLWLAIVVIASIKQLANGTRNAFFAVMHFFLWIVALLTPHRRPVRTTRPHPQSRPHFPFGHTGHPSLWLTIVQDIFMTIIFVALAFTFLYGLYLAQKRLIALLRWLARRLLLALELSLPAANDQAYRDEQEHLNRADRAAKTTGPRRRRTPQEPRWSELPDNRARVRWLYRAAVRRAIKDGYAFHSHLTPTQVGDELAEQDFVGRDVEMDLIAHYEAVRYGERDVSDEAVASLREQLMD